jgi:hypothetical protein
MYEAGTPAWNQALRILPSADAGGQAASAKVAAEAPPPPSLSYADAADAADAAAPDAPFLLRQVLSFVPMGDIFTYPRFYSGPMGVVGSRAGSGHWVERTDFRHGPWAAAADLNLTDGDPSKGGTLGQGEPLCLGTKREFKGAAGPWPALARLAPRAGRKALVATVSCSLCDLLGGWESFGKRPPALGGLGAGGLVLVGGGNENWGMVSEHVVNRTMNWGNFTNVLVRAVAILSGGAKRCSCPCFAALTWLACTMLPCQAQCPGGSSGNGQTAADFQAFLDDPRILLWLVNHHHAAGAVHPKVLSLPLGIKSGLEGYNPTVQGTRTKMPHLAKL